jgi:hypothetical protein
MTGNEDGGAFQGKQVSSVIDGDRDLDRDDWGI